MPALHFPNGDILRLALAAGVIPPAIAAAPVAAGFDDAGGVWVEAPADLPRDGFAALQRFGARALGPGGPTGRVFQCWHQLLPLKPSVEPASGPTLIEVPDGRLAAVVARLRRLAPHQVEVCFLPPGPAARAWVRLPALPPGLADHLADDGLTVYTRHGAGVWVRAGWKHPLADLIHSPAGSVILMDPEREWRLVSEPPFSRPPREYRLHRPAADSVECAPLPRVSIPLTLRVRGEPRGEEVWILNGGDGAFEAFLRGADERTLRGCRVSVVAAPDGRSRVILRPVRDRAAAAVPALSAAGYAVHPGLPALLVPATHTVVPAVRRDRLAADCGIPGGGLVWVEPGAAGGFALCRAESVRSRPASDLVEYAVPPVTRHFPTWGAGHPFAFDPVGPVTDPAPAELAPAAPPDRRPRPGDGWLTRLSKKLRRARGTPRVATEARAIDPPGPADEPGASPSEATVSPPAHEWAARRAKLEHRLIHLLPGLPADARADLWAEAAEVAAATGQHADAGLCWANAVWEAKDPPAAWYEAWLRAESRLAKVAHGFGDLGEWLTLTTRRVPPRLVAAYLAWCGAQPVPPSDLSARLPRLLALLEDRPDKLPVRAAWLGRLAAAELSDGDPLGLARWRDASFRRLAEGGPTLDLDAPAFVRFHGRPVGDRSPAARDWLLRMREPAQRWLARQASPRRLQWFGLDPETDATAGYLDLMFAWGASRLGERNVGRDWEEAAAGILGRPPGTGDAGVHAVLLAAFRHRIRDAQQGRPDRPGLPADVLPAYHQLTDFQRYAVDKLRRASGILEPVDRVNPYRGRDTVDGDDLGRRLRQLSELGAGDELDREVRSLLALAGRDPDTLPRVILAAVAAAPRLPADTARDVLARVPAAVRFAPESVWAGRGKHPPRVGLEEYLGTFLDAAAHAACVFDAPDVVRDLVRYLTGPAAPPAPIPQAALGPIAGRFFRALRRLGLTAEASVVLDRVVLTPPRADGVVNRVGFAVGWLAVGNEDAATLLLDEARERLFAVGFGPPRLRSRLAVAYAAALGHAPPRMALGRLEEIFQRLDGAAAHGTANRFFTVSILELIDAIVRSVVSDDFALGPEVRGWLDDAEFGTRRRISRDLDAVLAAATPDVPGPRRGG